jgi:hypothetical protein
MKFCTTMFTGMHWPLLRRRLRRIPGAAKRHRGEFAGIGEIQPPGLLVEEAAGSGRTGGVGLVPGVASGGVELHEPEALPADVQDGPDFGMIFPTAGDQGHQAVVPAMRADGAGGGAGDGNPHTARQIQTRKQARHGPSRIPAVEGIDMLDHLPALVDDGQRHRHRPDVDADDHRMHGDFT